MGRKVFTYTVMINTLRFETTEQGSYFSPFVSLVGQFQDSCLQMGLHLGSFIENVRIHLPFSKLLMKME